MHAIRSVDLEPFPRPSGDLLHFINRRRTEVLAGIPVLGRAAVVANVEVGDFQMARLVFLVMGAGVIDVGELVEGEPAVGLRLLGRRRISLRELLHPLVSCPGRIACAPAAPSGYVLQRAVNCARPEAVLEPLMEIPHFPELILHPARAPAPFEFSKRASRRVAGAQGFENRFGGKHSRLHREMDSFQPLRIEKAGAVADQERAVCGGRGDGKISAFGNGFRAVAEHLAALEHAPQPRVRLPLLKGAMRVEARVPVVEAGNEADGEFGLGERVNKSAAELA